MWPPSPGQWLDLLVGTYSIGELKQGPNAQRRRKWTACRIKSRSKVVKRMFIYTSIKKIDFLFIAISLSFLKFLFCFVAALFSIKATERKWTKNEKLCIGCHWFLAPPSKWLFAGFESLPSHVNKLVSGPLWQSARVTRNSWGEARQIACV